MIWVTSTWKKELCSPSKTLRAKSCDPCHKSWLSFGPALYNIASMPSIDHDFLRAALAGYQHHLAELHQRVHDIQARLGSTDDGATAPPKRRTMSKAARRKIAAAQKKRWAKAKQGKAGPAKPKRKMSAAARKAIGDAARKRWALVRAGQKGKRGK